MAVVIKHNCSVSTLRQYRKINRLKLRQLKPRYVKLAMVLANKLILF